MNQFTLLKSHIDAYTRKDGTVVQAHDDKRTKKPTGGDHDSDGLAGDIGLDHPAYNTPVSLKGYPKSTWNGEKGVTPFRAHNARDAANILIRNNPAWSKGDHLALAEKHDQAAAAHHKAWSDRVNKASQDAFGRDFEFGDYKVSGIARDEYSDEHKNALRTHAHSAGKHEVLAAAHRAAASSRLVSK